MVFAVGEAIWNEYENPTDVKNKPKSPSNTSIVHSLFTLINRGAYNSCVNYGPSITNIMVAYIRDDVSLPSGKRGVLS